jgi:pyruvate/2-oxoglutarate dehydrogenase complex dihydrolipoamide dehydrogenase (E3) component
MHDFPPLAPLDEHNRELLARVRPEGHRNPTPAPRYNLVVVGAGTAGLVAAAGAAGLGARVALVEGHLLGGDCLIAGCVPSKTLLRSARAAHEVRNAERLGVRASGGLEVDFGAAMARLRRVRAEIARNDSVSRFAGLGVDVFLGHGRFVAPDALEVEGARLRFARAVIATGGRAEQPAIPGLAEAGFLTNENVFHLTERPPRLAVVGGGPVGCELAQAFARLGSAVTLIHDRERLLAREDPDASELLARVLRREGVRLLLDAKLEGVQRAGGERRLQLKHAEGAERIAVDEILVGAGRRPNLEGLGLEAAGVRFDSARGVEVDDRLRTSNRRIFAAGDVCLDWKFTHAADAAARIVIQNALFLGRRRLSSLTMPWCTYTDPEIAHVGLGPREAEARGVAIDTFVRRLSEVDRALADDAGEGFVKVHVAKGRDRIVGATVVARNAGDLVSELSVAMAGGIGLARLAAVIHPYPTQAEAIRQLGDAYNRTRLTPGVRRWLGRWLAWSR